VTVKPVTGTTMRASARVQFSPLKIGAVVANVVVAPFTPRRRCRRNDAVISLLTALFFASVSEIWP
jgi:hypothetical protein